MKGLAWALVTLMLAAAPAAAQEWTHDVGLYGWLAGLEGTIGVGDVTEQPLDASFEDLAKLLDFAMAVHFEARKPKGLFIADVSYINLGEERDGMIANQPVKLEMDLVQLIFEAGGGWRVAPEIDVLLVGRYYLFDLSNTLRAQGASTSNEGRQTWADIYVGARYTRILREKWLLSLRGDVGVGGSDFAWFGNAGAGYRFSDRFSAMVSWRVLSLDREADSGTADYFKYDVTQSGLGVGVGYRF